MNRVDPMALAEAVSAISDEQRRAQVCQMIGQAHSADVVFFDWARWREACGASAQWRGPLPHLAPGGLLCFSNSSPSGHTYMRSLADVVASLQSPAERTLVAELLGAVYAEASPFFDRDGWLNACQARQPQGEPRLAAAAR